MSSLYIYLRASILISLIISLNIVVNGFPLFNIFSSSNNNDNSIINNYKITSINEKYQYIKENNFIVLNDNYTVNATVVKHSTLYDLKTTYLIGEITFHYNNYFHKHYHCKIIIDIPEQKSDHLIILYINRYYNLGKEIELFCNEEECIQKIYIYDIVYDIMTCNILNQKEIKDEF